MADDAVLKNIKLVAFDCDGVLTDSRLHYSSMGEVSMGFNTRDGEAIRLFSEAGIETALISTNRFNTHLYRASDLGIPYVWSPEVQEWSNRIEETKKIHTEIYSYPLRDDKIYYTWPKSWIDRIDPTLFETKLSYFEALCYSLHIFPEQCVYVGDTNTDLPILEKVGYPFVPYDHAITDIDGISNDKIRITGRSGGEGVLFEVWNFFYKS